MKMNEQTPHTNIPGFRNVLFKKPFFLFWTGQIISQFGDRLNQMALIALISQQTAVSPIAMSQLIFFMTLPTFLIGPIAGIYVDRWKKKETMIITDLLRAGLVLFLIYFMSKRTLIYLIIFLIFSINRFFIIAKLAFIPELVGKQELYVANSLSVITTVSAMLIGVVSGGIIISHVGPKVAFYIDIGTYLLSAGLLGLIPSLLKDMNKTIIDLPQNYSRYQSLCEEIPIIHGQTLKSVVYELFEGLKFVFTHRFVLQTAVISTVLMFGLGMIYVLGIVFLQQEMGVGIKGLGLLGGGPLGISLIIGTLLMGKFGNKIAGEKSVGYAFLIIGLSIFGIATIHSFAIIILLIGLCGLIIPGITIFVQSTVHKFAPPNVIGRCFSAMDFISSCFLSGAILLAGYLPQYIPIKYILSGVAGYFVIFGGYLWLENSLEKIGQGGNWHIRP